mmetsp:Transcript_76311/g.247530  ORF Transcript_76311/g.247530 Transcript_76311/m.247530 type:complete len:102 (+) Transcript_76311:2614-2919(+)
MVADGVMSRPGHSGERQPARAGCGGYGDVQEKLGEWECSVSRRPVSLEKPHVRGQQACRVELQCAASSEDSEASANIVDSHRQRRRLRVRRARACSASSQL